MGAETARVTADIPARPDRLPWVRWHRLVVIGLGTVWILDGLEVTSVGAMSDALKDPESGLGRQDITGIAVGYVIGAVLMVGAGIVAAFLGVRSEGRSLESIAQPLTAEDSAGDPGERAHA